MPVYYLGEEKEGASEELVAPDHASFPQSNCSFLTVKLDLFFKFRCSNPGAIIRVSQTPFISTFGLYWEVWKSEYIVLSLATGRVVCEWC